MPNDATWNFSVTSRALTRQTLSASNLGNIPEVKASQHHAYSPYCAVGPWKRTASL